MDARPFLLTVAMSALACDSSTNDPVGDGGGAPVADAADDSVAPSSTGLHRTCPAAGCATGQECITAAGPGGSTSTCEIRCTSEEACPDGLRCNLPPVVPDSIPNTCVES